jgi:hypothetical protein
MHHYFFIIKLISLHVGNKLRIERTRGNSFLGKKDEEQSSTILWRDCASKDVPSPHLEAIGASLFQQVHSTFIWKEWKTCK